MDTRQLKVGQIVILRSGSYGNKAKVLEVTPTGVIAQEIYSSDKIRFDISGEAIYSRDLGWNDGRIYNDALPIPGTFENGPWVIKEVEDPEEKTTE
jgi:hypothetical protein